MIALLLACGSPAPTDTGVDGPPCSGPDCVGAVATASYADPELEDLGSALVLSGDHVVIGAPADYTGASALAIADLPGLGLRAEHALGASEDARALAALDLDGRPAVAVGLPDHRTSTHGGEIVVIDPSIVGDLDAATLLTIQADALMSLGWSLVASGDELWASSNGLSTTNNDVSSALAFSADERGVLHQSDALRQVTGGLLSLGRWDGDHDGVDDLVLGGASGVAWFQGPWSTSTTDDRDAAWTSALHDAGEFLVDLGDVTGDGGSDLAVAGPLDPAWILESADGGPLDDQPIQLDADGMWAFAGADLDGDGQIDLIANADGDGTLAIEGEILVFRGPIEPGTHTPADADRIVYGGHADGLGSALLAIPGDGHDDLVVGAAGADAVYLLPGDSLL